MVEQSVTQPVVCNLCGLTTVVPIFDDAGQLFCCPACREVSALLAARLPAEKPRQVSPATTNSSVVNPLVEDSVVENSEVSTLSLAGMWCPSCAWLISESLQNVSGIIQADLSFLQREARITYDPAQIEPRGIAKRVRRLGYRAWLPGDKPYDDEEAHWNRLLASGVLVMHIMLFSFFIYGRDWLGISSSDTEWLVQFFNLLSGVAAIPVLLILGLPILRAGGAGLLRGRPNIHTLIALGAFSAFGLSVYNLIADNARVYFDTAAILLFLVALGRWLEMQAQKSSTEAVDRLFESIPTTATLISADGERPLPIDEVQPGARIRVRPGERFPVDGLVAVGEGDVDESLLSGEPEPVHRRTGERVLTGTYNLDGSFEVITAAVGMETVAGQIGRLLHQALWQRAPVERLADRLAALMVPVAICLAALTFLFWSYYSSPETGFVHALSVLLIACPCALGIATPLTLWLGIGRAAEAGLILRHTGVLEALAKVRRIFFDKTGTLSQRSIRLQAVTVEGDIDRDEFLARTVALEALSEHPFGQAIVSASATVPAADVVSDFRTLPGRGVMGRVDGTSCRIGSRSLMQQADLVLSPALEQEATQWQEHGWTVVYAGWAGRVTGLLGLGESIRSETAETLDQLRQLQIDVAVLTGDDSAAGKRWQAQLGVPVLAEQLPEDKLRHLEDADHGVAMVGDGINDGPALAAATVGIAVSAGADVAGAAADVVLISDDLRTVPWLFRLSQLVMRKVRQNLIWAFAYNIVGLGLAVSGTLQPAGAALLMVLSNAVVTTNALRLRRTRIGEQEATWKNEQPDCDRVSPIQAGIEPQLLPKER